jgi:hypothetical protein
MFYTDKPSCLIFPYNDDDEEEEDGGGGEHRYLLLNVSNPFLKINSLHENINRKPLPLF